MAGRYTGARESGSRFGRFEQARHVDGGKQGRAPASPAVSLAAGLSWPQRC